MIKSYEIDELEHLIDIAEDSSSKIREFKGRIYKQYLSVLIYAVFTIVIIAIWDNFYTSKNAVNRLTNYDFDVYIVFLITLGILIFFFLLLTFRRIADLRSQLYSESKALSRVFEIIGPYKESLDLTPIAKALIDMRLSRIDFNFKKRANSESS